MMSGVKHRLGGEPHADLGPTLTSMQQATAALADEIRHFSHHLHPALLEHAVSVRPCAPIAASSKNCMGSGSATRPAQTRSASNPIPRCACFELRRKPFATWRSMPMRAMACSCRSSTTAKDSTSLGHRWGNNLDESAAVTPHHARCVGSRCSFCLDRKRHFGYSHHGFFAPVS